MYQLNDILGNPVPLALLRFFLDNPSKDFYRAQITEKVGIAKASTGKWLSIIEEEKLLRSENRANAKFYRLNSSNVLVKHLKVLISLSDLLSAFEGFSEEAHVFGSVARGEDTKESDVDILIISDRPKAEVMKKLAPVSKRLSRKLSPVILTPIEFAQLSRSDKPFYERVIKDKIRISDQK